MQTVRLPELHGDPIEIVFLPSLKAHRGKLLSGHRDGVEIHAASFLRQRQIVFDTQLKQDPQELSRIYAHELAHFAWVRLGNARRRSWEALLDGEGMGGELGWSAEWRKQALSAADRRRRTRRWREYVCESFCDTAAWLFSDARRSGEFTLPVRARRARRRWFVEADLVLRISV